MFVKFSILQDVNKGLYYLHNLNPPVLHRDLNPYKILLNSNLVAKISNFRVASPYLPNQMTGVPGLPDFMPPEALGQHYGLPLDVFSFGCVICHVISQLWPSPLSLVVTDPKPKILSEVERRQHCINQINDVSLKLLTMSCLDNDPEKRPQMPQVCRRITSIITGHYSNDDSIRMAYSMAMKQGVVESRDLQVLLVGAENTGKTCLVSSFLGEEFVEGQAATKAVEVDVCKVYCKNWTRISHSDKTNLLHHQFLDQLKRRVVKELMPIKSSATSSMSKEKSGSTMPAVSATLTTSPKSPSVSSEYLPQPHPQDMQVGSSISQYDPDSLNLALWDFPGQIIFHNTHSVFISESGVITITFNASMKLTGEVVPRDGCPAPPECATIISSIHYWLQVVDSICSVQGREGDLSPLQPAVILAGTHIDLLHHDIKVARKIAKETILFQLIEELSDKQYAHHLVGMGEGIEAALEQFCFFVSNKCKDEEIERLKSTTVRAATSLRKKQSIYFLKIERALLQHKEEIISKSTIVEIVAKSTFPIAENSSEFKGTLRYFHEKRVILHFRQIESLKDIVILSPCWLAKLFSYIITAHSYKRGKGFDDAWKRLTKYGILHESLLQHMLDKFHSDYPSVVKVNKKQVVDILLCFHLVARITKEAWFNEEGYPSLPDSGDTFIVPSLVPHDNRRNPPNTTQERIVYFKFDSGFIPTSLLNQLIADCICCNVERNSRLLWMRHGKVGLQLGADQVYYISRCEEKSSIQLTITMPVRDDAKSSEERKELIDDIARILDDIMKVFMPAVKKTPVLLVPCPKCPTLHITVDEVCSGHTIFCTASGITVPLRGYYGDLLPHGSHNSTALSVYVVSYQ
ncbi:uncharacterized protein [Dysidea avara]|uniref:uncharacterized protein isoform X2 n=1 Tax=Dysidea avara TaxID=196820 RepID=UPI00333068AF